MTALRLAARTVKRYRAQTVLAITGVAVIGALLFDMLLLSRGLLLSFADLLDRAGYDVRIVGGGGMTLRVPIPGSDEISLEPDLGDGLFALARQVRRGRGRHRPGDRCAGWLGRRSRTCFQLN